MPDTQNYGKNVIQKFLLAAFAIVLILLLVKTFYSNRPKVSPQKVAAAYLLFEQSSQRQKAEEYLFSDLEKVEILGEKYKNLRPFNLVQKENPGTEPNFETQEIKVVKNKAEVKILEKTNRKEGFIFFSYKLPKEIFFKTELIKVGNWKNGYQWKITKVGSPGMIWEKKLGEKTEVKENFFVKPIKFERVKFLEGKRVYSLEIEYENNSNGPVFIYPFGEWRIIDLAGETLVPPSVTSALFLKEPILSSEELKPGGVKQGYVMFETDKEVSAKAVIFKNIDRKIIFNAE